MRGVVLLLCTLTACGRVGFGVTEQTDGDAHTDDGAADARPDIFVPAGTCVATQIALTLDSSPITDVIATPMPNGTALGFLTATSSAIAGVVVDNSLTPNASTPFRTSPVPGASYGYSRASLFWDGALLTGSVSVFEDGSCYLKTFMPDMSTFLVAEQRLNCMTGEPSVARAGATTISTWFSGVTLHYNALMSDGNPGATDYSTSFIGNIENLSVASGSGSVVAVTDTDAGDCDVYAFADGASGSAAGLSTPCARPHIVSTDNGGSMFLVAYEIAANSFRLRPIMSTDPFNLTAGSASATFTGHAPRLFAVAGSSLVAYRNATEHLEVLHPADGVTLPISGLPGAAPDAFEVAGPYVFATFGTSVYAITCN